MIKVNVKKSKGYPDAIKYLWDDEIVLISQNHKKETNIHTKHRYNSYYTTDLYVEESTKEIYDAIAKQEHNKLLPKQTFVQYKNNCFVNIKMINKIIFTKLDYNYDSYSRKYYTIILKTNKCIFANSDRISKIQKELEGNSIPLSIFLSNAANENTITIFNNELPY